MKNLGAPKNNGDILVVDDNINNLKTLSKLLTEKGYSVRGAPNGQTAITAIKTLPPELILLDVLMPDMDGYEVCRILKKDPKTSDIPIIFVSALDESENTVKGFQAGGVDFITKPFNPEEILIRVKTQLCIGQLQRQLENYNKILESEVARRTDELEASRERYRRLVEELPVGLFRITPSPDGRLLMANKALVYMLGYNSMEEIIQAPVDDLYQDATVQRAFTKELNRCGSLRHKELSLRRRDGSTMTGSVTAHAVRDQNGVTIYFDGIIEDITERRELEAQLRRTQKLEAVGTMAAGMAHDFKNILSTILGYADLALMETNKDTGLHELLQGVKQAGLRGRSLIKQILTFSRQPGIEREPVRIVTIIKEVLTFLSPSLPTGFQIKQSLDVVEDSVIGDATQIHQVVMNLCTNAIQAMKPHGGLLEISLEEISLTADDFNRYKNLAQGEYLLLTVKDSGHGIAPEIIDRIFDPFFSTKDRAESIGMGLAMVHGIIKDMGGTVSVDSQPGQGAMFQVLLSRVERGMTP